MRWGCLSSLTRLSRVRSFLPFEIKRVMLYNALVATSSHGLLLVVSGWNVGRFNLSHKIKQLQNYGMQLITSSPWLACSAVLRSRLKWVPLEQGRAPQYLCSKFATRESLGLRTTRGSKNLHLKRPATDFYHNCFEYQGTFDWNHFPDNIKTTRLETAFKIK